MFRALGVKHTRFFLMDQTDVNSGRDILKDFLEKRKRYAYCYSTRSIARRINATAFDNMRILLFYTREFDLPEIRSCENLNNLAWFT